MAGTPNKSWRFGGSDDVPTSKKGWTFQVLPTAGWKSVWEVLNPRKKYPLVMKVRVCETRIHPTQKHHACFVGCSPKNSMFWLEPLWKRVSRWWKHRCDSTESSGAFPDFTVIFTCSAGVTGTIAPFILMTMGSTLSERHTFVYPVYPKQPQMNKINFGNGSRGQTLFSTKTHVIQIGTRYITTVVQNRRLNTQNTIGRWSKIDNLGGLKVRYY